MPCSRELLEALSRQVMGLQWRAGEAISGAAGRVEESLTKGLKAGIRVPGVQLHQCVRAGAGGSAGGRKWWAGSWVGLGSGAYGGCGRVALWPGAPQG